ncbi:antibiotic biosynthesis monooxygenase [Azorhizobium oxalatiphilum]|uniref:Antibiotic biosynthesis monooxygenase n=1 Tax=Azorhizobium oxalatiphilum TaxID=980631 RepID=A0A917BYD3_9HYPH|nr:putative quinol monooxygenase [Azorhizobium oxalatiphilum]GGF61751.1 antibiotic biosynthesis monooxygenase [Azorhizobium oxalatiphilum]
MSNVKIVAILKARPGKTEELKALLAGMVGSCRAEPGNLRWDIWVDQADAGRFILDELYVDQAAVTAHRETEHFKHYFAHINDLAERASQLLDPVDVA